MKESINKTNITIKGVAQREIELRVWQPQTTAKKVIVISHGMGEHIDRYDTFAQFAVGNKCAVIGANHRGHGEDASLLGHFSDESGWDKVLNDLDCVVEYAKNQFSCPVVLVGHSMGSFVARHYALLFGAKLSGLVLCGSNYQTPLLFKVANKIAQSQALMFGKRHPSALLEFLSFGAFNLTVKNARTRMDWLNRVDAEVDKYIADPLCGFRCTTQFWVDFMGGLAWSSERENLQRLNAKVPVLIVSGDKDPVSRMGKGAIVLQKILVNSGVERVDLKLYAQARHELFLEQNRQEFYNDLVSWLIDE